jgi:hypothetical protein
LEGKEVREGEWITKVYTVTRLSAIEPKVHYDEFYEAQPKVLIAPLSFRLAKSLGSNSSWSEFGNWFLELNSDLNALSPATKRYIDDMKREKSQNDLVRELYHYMQDRTRYVSIQLGIGGFQSLPAKDVEEHGYGDCKALTTYMKSLLEYAGMKANYILVRAGENEPDVVADFPSNQFNHVFLGIPGKVDTLYLECTSQNNPFGYVGTFTDDRNVLWVERNSSKIVRGKKYDHENNMQRTISDVKIHPNGNADIKLNVTNRGTFFEDLAIFKMAPKDYVDKFNKSKFNFSDFGIKDFTYQHAERDSAEFVSNYQVAVNGLGKVVESKILLPIVITNPITQFISKDDYKKYCSIRRGLTVEEEVNITLPKNAWTENLPPAVNLSSPYGSYELRYEQEGAVVRVTRKFVLFKGQYREEKFDGFSQYLSKIITLEKRKLILNSKT